MSDHPTLAIDAAARADALVLSAVLHASVRVLGPWSLGLSLAAVGLVALVSVSSGLVLAVAMSGGVLLLGLIERYLAFRLALDQRLFAALGNGGLPDLTTMDVALAQIGLRKAPKTVRSWRQRVQGTRGLVKCHAVVVALQTVFLFFSFCLLGVH